jgi:AcrR family transcriptional regulator
MLKPVPTTSLDERLDDILKKSASLMATRGYHGTSMRDLAEATGRSLSGLYHYFQGKEDLLFLVNQRGFSAMLDMVTELQKTDIDEAETLATLIRNHICYFTDHMNEMHMMMVGTLELAPNRSKEINALKESYRKRVQTIVDDYIKANHGTQLSNAELTRKTYLLFGMMNWIFGWYSSGTHGSADELANDIFNTFTTGCITIGTAQ